MKNNSAESSDTDKDNVNNIRIPSPSSSSINSIKQPLEWDSGADVGYLCNSATTSEHRNGKVNDKTSLINTCDIQTPLAKSTPNTLKTQDVSHHYTSNTTNSHDIIKTALPSAVVGKHLIKKVCINKRLCRSLDCLNVFCAEFSRNLKGQLFTEEHNDTILKRNINSSSSASTIIPVHSLKSDNNPIERLKSNDVSLASKQSLRSTKNNQSNVYISPNDSNTNSNEYGNRSNSKASSADNIKNKPMKIYGLQENSGSNTTNNINSSECFSGSDSFRYVSGAVYESHKLNKGPTVNAALLDTKSIHGSNSGTNLTVSDVDTVNSKVQHGVNMIRQYIDELNTSKQNKIKKKIAEALLTNGDVVTTAHKAGRTSDLIKNASSVKKETHLSISSAGNSFSHPDDFQKYLVKEREIQIMWIKSGTDYLNNLKRLFECQEELRKLIVSNHKDQPIQPLRSSSKAVSSSMDVATGVAESTDVKTTSSQTDATLSSSNRSNQIRSMNKNMDGLVYHKCYLSELSGYLSSNELSSSGRNIVQQTTVYSTKLSSPRRLHCRSRKKKDSNRVGARETINVSDVVVSSAFCQRCEKLIKHPTCTACQKDCKQSLSYTVSFTKSSNPKKKLQKEIRKINSMESDQPNKRFSTAFASTQNKPWMEKPLQDYLIQNRPEYVQCAELRRQYLKEMTDLRDLRAKIKRELVGLLDNSDEDIANRVKRIIPPPPLATIRIFDSKTMRKQTERKYRQLPEVLDNKHKEQVEKMYRTNRIMAKVFTKKLQRKVLKGQINISNSASVISG